MGLMLDAGFYSRETRHGACCQWEIFELYWLV